MENNDYWSIPKSSMSLEEFLQRQNYHTLKYTPIESREVILIREKTNRYVLGKIVIEDKKYLAKICYDLTNLETLTEIAGLAIILKRNKIEIEENIKRSEVLRTLRKSISQTTNIISILEEI